MTIIVGSNGYEFELADGWEQLPAGWTHDDVADVAVDSRDRVYVFNRDEHPVIVYDRDGRFLSSWGEGVFKHPHAVTCTAGDVLYLVDDGDHTVRKTTTAGEVLQVIGNLNQPSATGYTGTVPSILRAGPPFNRPTCLARAADGSLYVSDGYGNARVHHFDAGGKLLHSWGEPGYGPGQFHLPHCVWIHTDGRVFVCDRENHRIQVFSPSGELLKILEGFHRPTALCIDADEIMYVTEVGHDAGQAAQAGGTYDVTKPSEVSVRDIDGNVITKWGSVDMEAPGMFIAPHCIALDSRGDLYVGEVARTEMNNRGKSGPPAHSFQKFVRR